MRLQLPGFVLRQFDADPQIARDRLRDIVTPAVHMGRQRRQFSFRCLGDDSGSDIGPHLDSDEPWLFRRSQINLYRVGQGALTATLFTPTRQLRRDLRTGRTNARKTNFYINAYREGKIDDDLVVPIGHVVKGLKPRDILIFSDNSSVHDFTTEETPRNSTGTLYFARPTLRSLFRRNQKKAA
jgi:hypothetical protein